MTPLVAAHEILGNPAWHHNWTRGGRTLHGEVMDTSSGDVWLAQEPLDRTHYNALELPAGFVRTGVGCSSADIAYFRRSPGASQDGPLEIRALGGVTFARVARPGQFLPGFGDVLVLDVHKHHKLLFTAGRTLEILDPGDGTDHVPQVDPVPREGARAGTRPRLLPAGWSVRLVALEQNLVVELPCPARVCFFPSGHSFAGPVQLSRHAVATRGQS